MRLRSPAGLVALVALVVALATRLWSGFAGLYGQDAYAYFDHARALPAWLLRGEPLPEMHWPWGYSLLVAALQPLLGVAAAGQVVSALGIALAAASAAWLASDAAQSAPGGNADPQ